MVNESAFLRGFMMKFFRILYLAVPIGLAWATPVQKVSSKDNVCTVHANGNQEDDVPNILKAFQQCGNGGTVIFPEDQSYWIATRLNPILNNVVIEWRGKWTVCDPFNFTISPNLTHGSSLTTSTTGATTLTPSLSRITARVSSSPVTISPSMDTALAGLMAMVTSGTTQKKATPSQGGRCHLFSGMYPRSTSTTSTSEIPRCGA